MSQAVPQAKHRAPDATPSATMPSSTTELEAQIEATREQLASTLDQLIYRVKPSTVIGREKAKLRARFVNPDGSPNTANIAKVAAVAGGVVGFLVLVRVMGNRHN